jgi:glycosyltransferase involved in cell wall biosynthesis
MSYRIRVLAGRVDSCAGSHVYDRELVTRLAARGHRVSLVCRQAVPEVLAAADVREIPWYLPQTRLWWRFASMIEHRDSQRRLQALDLPPVDVVIGTEHLFLKAHSRRFPKTPWIYLPHAFLMSEEIRSYGLPPVMQWVSTQVFTRLQRWALNRADRTVRFTQQGCDVISDFYGRRVRPRFVVNPVGVEIPAAMRIPRANAEVRLLFVGRLVRSKNLDFIIRVLGELRDLPWRLDVVGEGDQRLAWETLTAELGLQDRIRFHGQQDQPGAFYAAADLFLFPSKLESCGIVLFEAMSYGVPSLALRADGIEYRNVFDEIIDPGRTGLLAHNEADFRRQLSRVLQHPALLGPLGSAAREHVAQNHSWDRHLNRYEELFESLTNAAQLKAQTLVGGNRGAPCSSESYQENRCPRS